MNATLMNKLPGMVNRGEVDYLYAILDNATDPRDKQILRLAIAHAQKHVKD